MAVDRLLAWGLLLLAAQPAGGLLFEGVPVLDKQDVTVKVLSSSKPVSLGVFSSDPAECEGCEVAFAEFAKAAGSLRSYGVESFAVDCTGKLPRCSGLTQALHITHLPAIKTYTGEPTVNPYTGKAQREQVPFEGDASARSIQRHTLRQIPNTLLERVTSATMPPPDLDGLGLVLLFTDRDTPSALYKAVAFKFRGRLAFAEVHASETGLTDLFAVETFPTLLVTRSPKADALDKGFVFKGDLKSWDDITEFLEGHAADAHDQSASAATGDRTDDGADASEQGAASVHPSALVLGADDFGATVLKSKDAWVVLFRDGSTTVARGDEDDAKVTGLAEWAKAAGKADGMIRAAEVDCTVSAALCDGTAALPYVQVYGYGFEEKNDVLAVERFPAANSAQALAAAGDSLPDRTVRVNGMTIDMAMVEAMQSERLLLVLLSTRDEPPPLLKSLALSLEAACAVAFFPGPDDTTMMRFQLDRVPTFLMLFPSEPEAETRPNEVSFGVRVFEPQMFGRPTFDALIGFALGTVNQFFPDNAQRALDQAQADWAAGPGRGASAGGQGVPEVTPATWAEACPEKASTLCAVAFLSGGPDSPTFDDEIAVLKAVQASHVKDPYKFSWVDGSCRLGFADAFDVQPSKLPTVIAYSPRKQRVAGFVGVFGVEPVNDLLSGVLSGRVKTRPLYQAPAVDDADCAALAAATAATEQQQVEDAVAEEEDLGDLMAEILAEEARAKETLAEEIAREAAERAEAEAKAKADAAAAAADAKKSSKKKKKKKGKKSKSKSEL